MKRFPYMTDYVNEVFEREKERWDYILLRPVLVVSYFFIRLVAFPIKFVLHRKPFGFEAKVIDTVLAFGIKYLASEDAIKLLVRHVQIEPLLYRYLLSGTESARNGERRERLKGIDGDFSVDSIEDVVRHGLTICHDDLSYEVVERFKKQQFLQNLDFYRSTSPESHEQFSKSILEQNRRYSLQWFGATNVVIFIVITITIFGDLQSVIRALNSFGSDSVLLWCLKNIYADDKQAMIDLDFYMQTDANRNHYNSSAFFSDPSQYLYYHIAFDEFAYELLRKNQSAH
ncbi:MAG: hypothetical protein KDD69_09790 [Bdellovibrionales bacterium]|nr:hypothetical protein [Bdellovibrionales bacterium]